MGYMGKNIIDIPHRVMSLLDYLAKRVCKK